MDISTLTKEFGLLGLTLGTIVALFGFIVHWITAQLSKELDCNRKERAEYLNTLSEMRIDMRDHNERAKEAHASTQLEHKEMIITLGRINGYKHD